VEGCWVPKDMREFVDIWFFCMAVATPIIIAGRMRTVDVLLEIMSSFCCSIYVHWILIVIRFISPLTDKYHMLFTPWCPFPVCICSNIFNCKRAYVWRLDRQANVYVFLYLQYEPVPKCAHNSSLFVLCLFSRFSCLNEIMSRFWCLLSAYLH